MLESDDPHARKSVAALVRVYGDDPLATFHLKQLLAGDHGAEIIVAEK